MPPDRSRAPEKNGPVARMGECGPPVRAGSTRPVSILAGARSSGLQVRKNPHVAALAAPRRGARRRSPWGFTPVFQLNGVPRGRGARSGAARSSGASSGPALHCPAGRARIAQDRSRTVRADLARLVPTGKPGRAARRPGVDFHGHWPGPHTERRDRSAATSTARSQSRVPKSLGSARFAHACESIQNTNFRATARNR
jgi:hypothetical protein